MVLPYKVVIWVVHLCKVVVLFVHPCTAIEQVYLLHSMVDLLVPLFMKVEGNVVFESWSLWIDSVYFLAKECLPYWVESTKYSQLLDMDSQDTDQS
jgi:hypothetical protein